MPDFTWLKGRGFPFSLRQLALTNLVLVILTAALYLSEGALHDVAAFLYALAVPFGIFGALAVAARRGNHG